jgi:hypothetical protein
VKQIDATRLADLNEILAEVPLLNEESESFAKDMEEIRASLRPESDSWGSEENATQIGQLDPRA